MTRPPAQIRERPGSWIPAFAGMTDMSKKAGAAETIR
jgi:hypothetical protein